MPNLEPPSLWLSIPLFVFIGTWFTVHTIREYYRSKSEVSWVAYLAMMAYGTFVFFLTSVKGWDEKAFRYVISVLGPHGTQFLVATIAIAVGWGAYRFKHLSQLWYGLSEVMFGVFSSVLIVSTVNFTAVEFKRLSLAQYGTLVGCAYVIARGLGNYTEGKAKLIAPTAPSTNP